MEEELPVSLRAGEPGVYDAHDGATPRGGRARQGRKRPAVDIGVADYALRDVLAAGPQPRLHEHPGPPTGAGVVHSGVPGPTGTREFFLHLVNGSLTTPPDKIDGWIEDAVG